MTREERREHLHCIDRFVPDEVRDRELALCHPCDLRAANALEQPRRVADVIRVVVSDDDTQQRQSVERRREMLFPQRPNYCYIWSRYAISKNASTARQNKSAWKVGGRR